MWLLHCLAERAVSMTPSGVVAARIMFTSTAMVSHSKCAKRPFPSAWRYLYTGAHTWIRATISSSLQLLLIGLESTMSSLALLGCTAMAVEDED